MLSAVQTTKNMGETILWRALQILGHVYTMSRTHRNNTLRNADTFTQLFVCGSVLFIACDASAGADTKDKTGLLWRNRSCRTRNIKKIADGRGLQTRPAGRDKGCSLSPTTLNIKRYQGPIPLRRCTDVGENTQVAPWRLNARITISAKISVLRS